MMPAEHMGYRHVICVRMVAASSHKLRGGALLTKLKDVLGSAGDVNLKSHQA